jgi:hypothetical protein
MVKTARSALTADVALCLAHDDATADRGTQPRWYGGKASPISMPLTNETWYGIYAPDEIFVRVRGSYYPFPFITGQTGVVRTN